MYPIDRRQVAAIIYSNLNSLRKTGILLQVSHTTVMRWLVSPIKKPRRRLNDKILKSESVVEIISCTIKNDPFISIRKLRELIKTSIGINVSLELIRVAIKKQGLTKKKARFFGEPKNLKEKTDVFLSKRKQYLDENKIFLSIDETSFGRNGFIMHGYSEKGKRLLIRKKNPRTKYPFD